MIATPRAGVSASRFRKPVSMSRPSSIAELSAVKSAPCTNGIANMKSTYESAGKPGSADARSSPLASTKKKKSGKTSANASCPGWRIDRMNARRPRTTICSRVVTRRRARPALRPPARLVCLAFEAVPGLREEDVVERRRVELEVVDRHAFGIERAHDVGEVVSVVEPRGDAARLAFDRHTEPVECVQDPLPVPRLGGDDLDGRPADLRLERARRALGDDPPAVDDPDPVGEDVGFFEVLRGEEDRDAVLLREAGDLDPERVPALRVEPGRRLVEEEDRRPVEEREREVEPPLHPARVRPHLPVGRLRQPDSLEQLVARAFRSSRESPWSDAWRRTWSRPER